MLIVFFSPNQSVKSKSNSFRPSAGKPDLFVEYLKKYYADFNLS